MSEPTAAPVPAPAGAPAAAATGFTAEQNSVIASLSGVLKLLGPLLVLAGLARIGYGVVEIATASWGGLPGLPQGALLAFAGLTLTAGSADANYLATVQGREKPHLSNTLDSILTGFNALLILGCYVAFIAFIKIWM